LQISKSFKHALLILCFPLLNYGFAFTVSTEDPPIIKEDAEIVEEFPYEQNLDSIRKELNILEESIYKNNIEAYNRACVAVTQLISYVTLVAAVVGIILTIAGIYIAYEGIRTHRRREKVIRTIEEAKSYLETQISAFDKTIKTKTDEIDKMLKDFTQISLDELSQDVEDFAKKLKKKEEKGITTEVEKKIGLLERRIKFFEEIGIPDDPKLLFSKAGVCMEKGMLEESLELLQRAVKLNPKEMRYYKTMADVLKSLEKYEEALDSIDKAIELNPDDLYCYWKAGRILNQMNEPRKALYYYEKAEEVEKKKISRPDADVGDQLNYYENLLILSKYDEAEKLRPSIETKITDRRNDYIYKFVTTCLFFLRKDITEGWKQITSIVKMYDKTPPSESYFWNFEDLNAFLHTRLTKDIYLAIVSLENLLDKKISAKECNAQINNLRK
jgi:tetratricopeptide (TPR) repeat protein